MRSIVEKRGWLEVKVRVLDMMLRLELWVDVIGRYMRCRKKRGGGEGGRVVFTVEVVCILGS